MKSDLDHSKADRLSNSAPGTGLFGDECAVLCDTIGYWVLTLLGAYSATLRCRNCSHNTLKNPMDVKSHRILGRGRIKSIDNSIIISPVSIAG